MASEDAFWPQRYIEDLRGSAALRPPGKLVPRKMGRGGPSPAQIILSENVRRWRQLLQYNSRILRSLNLDHIRAVFIMTISESALWRFLETMFLQKCAQINAFALYKPRVSLRELQTVKVEKSSQDPFDFTSFLIT